MKAVCWAVPLAGLLCLGGVSRVEGQPPQAAATAPSEDLETNLCTEDLLMGDPRLGPSWNGWGNGGPILLCMGLFSLFLLRPRHYR